MTLPSCSNPDTILCSLNKGIRNYVKFCEQWKLQINDEKSEAIFSPCAQAQEIANCILNINYNEIPCKNSIKYYAVVFQTLNKL